ncbi:MAG: N-acyl-D-amino-acid deacylase [Chloroflexi bacterium]|nr:N-acyl-D-amino-acid deacylase [Chloroflexota bacterium]
MVGSYPIVLTNGKIVDGCGNPWFWGDLAIRNGRIAQIAPPGTLHAERTIDVKGCYITPGFIDIHTHSDLAILINRAAESAVRQGVTTQIIGNCGMTPAPVDEARLADIRSYWGDEAEMPGVTWGWRDFGDYLSVIQQGGIAINIGALVGHAALRIAGLGFEERAPTATELDKMKSLVAQAMQAGAFGLSTGLVYPPGCFADTHEIIELCQVVSKYGGIYTSHIRGERETILEAVAEAIHIGQAAHIPLQISHNAPKIGAPCDAHANLRLVEEARAQGQDVTVDNDVHTDLAPALVDALPQRLHHLTIAEIQALLMHPETRAQIRDEIVNDRRPAFGPAGLLRHRRWERIFLLHAPATPELVGKSIEVIADESGKDPFDSYFDLILANGREVVGIFDYIDEENIRILLQHPAVMICSDGAISATYGPLSKPSPYAPCSYGEFPGVLERYVRDNPVLTLEQAIRKMTSFPAQRLGLRDRGVLRPGAWADIVILDMDRIHDRATNLWPHDYPFENYPHQYPEGIDYVFVNGKLVIEGERHTGERAGRVLRRANY